MADDARDGRRRFLRDSSAAVLLGAATAARASAAEKGQPNAEADGNEGDERRVRVAVVGTGGRGSELIRQLTTIERANVVALCDDYAPHLERARTYAEPGVLAFVNFADMLKHVKLDAVVVATPLDRHYEMCRAALAAGCAVFCEKTMCHALDDARKLAAEVEERQAVFQVGLQRRANPIYRQAQAMIQSGMLGRVTAIKCQWHRNNNWRRPVPVPRADPAFAELERRLNWRLYWATSQGLMTELASHQLDVANWLLGTTPKRVIGSGGIDYWRDGREVFDNVFCTYEYELPTTFPHAPKSKPAAAASSTTSASRPTEPETYTARVTYSSLQTNAFEGASELVLGTKGTLFLTQKKGLFYREAIEDPGWVRGGRADENAAVIASGRTLKMSNDPWAHRGAPYEIDTDGDDTRDELVDFLRCVAHGNRKTICPASIGLRNTATVLMGNEAMRTRQAVEFPADIV